MLWIFPTDFSPGVPAAAGLPVVRIPMSFYPSNTAVTKSKTWGLVTEGPNIPSVAPIQDKKTHTNSIRFGLSFLGPKWSKETLVGLAYACEQRTHTRLRVKPYIQPNV